MAATLDGSLDEIRSIQARPAPERRGRRAAWPMIVLRSPKGWTGPKVVDGMPVEGTWRAHQVPIAEARGNAEPPHSCSSSGCGATGPKSCSTTTGGSAPGSRACRRRATRRMSANPHANGGAPAARPRPARLPRLRRRRVERPAPTSSEATRVLGAFLRDVIGREPANFRLFGPDETASNRLNAVFEVDRPGLDGRAPARRDDHLAPDGRVMEVLVGAPVPGLAGGLPADGPPRPVQLLRGVHPHHRLDVQPAREVAEGHARHPVAPPDRVAELPAVHPRLAPGPQRLLATRTRASSTTSSTRRPT